MTQETQDNSKKVLLQMGAFSQPPTQGYEGDFAWDVYAAEQVLIPPHMFESTLINTGLQTAFDETQMGMFLSMRSGAAKKTPLIVANSPGIVEGTFRNDVQVLVRNTYTAINTPLVDYVLHLTDDGVVKKPVKDVQRGTLDKARDAYSKNMGIVGEQTIEDLPEAVQNELFSLTVPKGTILIERGDRIAQMSFIPKLAAYFELADGDKGLPDSTRGKNGTGSSGAN